MKNPITAPPREVTPDGFKVYCAYDEIVETDSLKPNPRNPNRHPEAQVKMLAHIIAEQGWRAPITVSRRSGYIVRGHARRLASYEAGSRYAPIEWQDYDNDSAEMADLVADNRIAELAVLDQDAIAGILAELKENTDDLDPELSGFTAEQIVALLSEYGRMSGCDADMLDGKHADAFAADKHSHSASDITSGNLPIERGGTGAGTSADACRALGAMRNTGGTFTGTVYFANGTAHYVSSAGDAHFRSVTASEDIHAKRVFEAVYNDYAELMPRGEDTEPGDIIALDTNSRQEKYVKATNLSSRIAGIHSDEYGMLIGGERVNDGEDFLKKNLPRFIPVSLAGRVHTKVIGPVNTGDCIVLSHIPGVGRAAKPCEYVDPCKVVGYAVEGDNLTEQRRLKVRVRGA